MGKETGPGPEPSGTRGEPRPSLGWSGLDAGGKRMLAIVLAGFLIGLTLLVFLIATDV